MYLNTQAGGQSNAAPDTCKTPAPNGTVPMPYPNLADGSMADASSASSKVTVENMSAHTLKTKIPTTSGDEAGTAGGVVSGCVKGEAKWTMCSAKVTIENQPATRQGDATAQNGSSANIVGATSTPSQTKVKVN